MNLWKVDNWSGLAWPLGKLFSTLPVLLWHIFFILCSLTHYYFHDILHGYMVAFICHGRFNIYDIYTCHTSPVFVLFFYNHVVYLLRVLCGEYLCGWYFLFIINIQVHSIYVANIHVEIFMRWIFIWWILMV